MNSVESWKYIRCFDWLDIDNKKIMCLTDRNAFCEVDELTKNVKVIGRYPDKGMCSDNLSWSIVELEDKVIFVPLRADSIAVYDKATTKLRFVDLSTVCNERTRFIDENGLFFTAFRWKDYVYMLGWCYPAILRYDERNDSFEKIDGWVDELKENAKKDSGKFFFGNGYVQHDNQFILPLCYGNCLLILNADSMDWKLVSISSKANGFCGIAEFCGTIWLSDFSGKANVLTRVDPNTLVGNDVEIPSEIGKILNLIVVDDVLCVISLFGDGFYTWNNSFEYIGKIKYPWEGKTGMVLAAKDISGEICLVENDGKWYRYSFQTGKYDERQYVIKNQKYLEESWSIKEKEVFDKAYIEPLSEGSLGLGRFIQKLIRS